jgi:hypothetical protein
LTKVKEWTAKCANPASYGAEDQMIGDHRRVDNPTPDLPRIAAVSCEADFPIDEFFAGIVAALRADNLRLGGAIQQNTATAGPAACCGDMVLVDLASGERVTISQDLGAEAEACRLDSAGLNEMSGRLELNVDESIDLLILNKFGKAEAEGNGFRSVIARAMDVGVPLLTAVKPLHREAWHRFHGGLAAELSPESGDVLTWCRRAAGAGRLSRAARP